MPGIGILALGAAAGTDGAVGARPPPAGRWALGAVAACWILGLPANLGPAWSDAFRRLPAASGATPADTYYEASHGPWPAVRWANTHLPEDAVVALFFDWSGGLLERPFHLGSVEDHVPSRHWLKTHGDQSLVALQARGVSHVMVRRVRFLTKAYPFLSPETLQADFNGPVADLDELLLQGATLIFEENGSRIYRIDGPATAR